MAAARQLPQPGQLVGDVRPGQVGPADHTRDQLAPRREGEELRGLLGHGDRLYEDRAVDAGGPCLRCEVRHAEITSQWLEFGPGDPVLVADREVPHVVVRVHRHGSSHTTGSPA